MFVVRHIRISLTSISNPKIRLLFGFVCGGVPIRLKRLSGDSPSETKIIFVCVGPNPNQPSFSKGK